MNQDEYLTYSLLVELSKRETELQEGDSIVVQPFVDGLRVENPVVIRGFGHDQVDARLRLLLREGLIENGGVGGELCIGIFFSRLTMAGRIWLACAFRHASS